MLHNKIIEWQGTEFTGTSSWMSEHFDKMLIRDSLDLTWNMR